ncbi:hypothetical protein QJS10_CPB20g00995 [Acorus calamus]|uniref:Factor of DNA methylation 1-5/IDN2 domain-containing protein n=1 Tax=Acorus calamus TaxID=4465 RepID=A0AAV9CAW4_ACOCL|nr:hypothetical protein QJS10_CPB20g00995 [Acorus calamus]
MTSEAYFVEKMKSIPVETSKEVKQCIRANEIATRDQLIAALADEVYFKNKCLKDLELQHHETTLSLHKFMLENEKLHQAYTQVVQITHKLYREDMDAKQRLEGMKMQMHAVEKLRGLEEFIAQIQMHEMKETLKEKIDEIDYIQSVNQSLIIKERKINDELQEARKEFIDGLSDIQSPSSIGIKRMGELDETPFKVACKRRYAAEDSDCKAARLCLDWQEEIRKPGWHPFKIISTSDEENRKESSPSTRRVVLGKLQL